MAIHGYWWLYMVVEGFGKLTWLYMLLAAIDGHGWLYMVIDGYWSL